MVGCRHYVRKNVLLENTDKIVRKTVVDIAKIQWLVTKALESVMEDALTDGDGPCVIKNVTTERMGQIAVVTVVTVIKDSHVTRRRGRVLRDVGLDMIGCTAI